MSVIRQYGMSEQPPAILPYPQIKKFAEVPSIKGLMCHFIKPYVMSGVSVVIYESGKKLKIGDFNGTTTKLSAIGKGSPAYGLLAGSIPKIARIMGHARIIQAEYYFSDGKLVDVQLSINKFLSPGMIKDLFGKVIDIQETIKIAQANDKEIKGINAILKPLTFKTTSGSDMTPLYCMI